MTTQQVHSSAIIRWYRKDVILGEKKIKDLSNHVFAFLYVLELRSKSGLLSILNQKAWGGGVCSLYKSISMYTGKNLECQRCSFQKL